MIFKVVKSLVAHALTNCLSYEWSLQGFGMLRLYMPDGCRLNVWDSKYRVPNVSMIHTHPWHFESLIVSGYLTNQRYDVVDDDSGFQRDRYSRAIIKPGIGGGYMSALPTVRLYARASEFYTLGQSYEQKADEVHMSQPRDGTITFNMRERVAADEAQVFWPLGEQWVDAMPRIATHAEVTDICERALKGL